MLKLDDLTQTGLRPNPNLSFKWTIWVCLPVLGIALQNFIHLLWRTFNPIQLDYSEGLLLSGVHRILSHPWLADTYSFNQAFYDSTDLAYPPVFPYLAALMAQVLSFFPGLKDLTTMTTPLYAIRILTLIGLVGSGWSIYRIVRLYKASRLVSLTATGLFFSFHPVIYWGSTGRVDALGLAFTLAGLYRLCLVTLKRGPQLGQFSSLQAIPWFCLAFFTKQSLVAAPLAVIIYLGISGRKKEAVLFAGLTSLVFGAGLLALTLFTQGNYLFFITMERFTPFSLVQLLQTWGLSLALYWLFILLAFWQAPKVLRTCGMPYRRLILIWGIVALFVSFTVGKNGAADYYFMEVMAFLSIMTGYVLAAAPKRGFKNTLLKGGFLLQVLILLGVSFWLNYQSQRQDNLLPAYQKATAYLQQYSTNEQEIFSELSGPALAAGHFGQVFDHFLFRQLAQAHIRDGQALVQDVIQVRFKVMLMGSDVFTGTDAAGWPLGFEDALRQHYHLLEALQGKDGQIYAWVLVPK